MSPDLPAAVLLHGRDHQQVFGEDALLNISVEREASGAGGSCFQSCCSRIGADCFVKNLWFRPHVRDKCVAGSLAGAVRIRAKTQGIALSLGDRVTAKQKGK